MERNWSKYSIMVVDDDFTSVVLFEEYLALAKAIVFSASNGGEAMDVLKSHPIDIILMDLQLEDISGYLLLSKIRAEYPNVPVIAETAFAAPDDRRKCIASGFNGYLSKPIDYESLIVELDKYLDKVTNVKPGV
ncbi:MAG: response regulator [Bacteroidales bacterium]|nr:response regulator [Bacteroidales bacterium]